MLLTYDTVECLLMCKTKVYLVTCGCCFRFDHCRNADYVIYGVPGLAVLGGEGLPLLVGAVLAMPVRAGPLSPARNESHNLTA